METIRQATTYTFKKAQDAFDQAINEGRLTPDFSGPRAAGQYMYMGTENGRDLFKHIITREYLPH